MSRAIALAALAALVVACTVQEGRRAPARQLARDNFRTRGYAAAQPDIAVSQAQALSVVANAVPADPLGRNTTTTALPARINHPRQGAVAGEPRAPANARARPS